MTNYYIWIYHGQNELSGDDHRSANANVEEEARFSDVFIDTAEMYYEFHQGHHDNENSCLAHEVPNAEAMSFLNPLDEQKWVLHVYCYNIFAVGSNNIVAHQFLKKCHRPRICRIPNSFQKVVTRR